MDQIVKAAECPQTDGTIGSPAEQRSVRRRRVLKDGIITYGDKFCAIECTVKDTSTTGVKLLHDNHCAIPLHFTLIIPSDGIEVDCEIVWRTADKIGARFLGQPRQKTARKRQTVVANVPIRKPQLRIKPLQGR